ncbi:MAG: four helix bundle protein [Calditrichia bacterium]
MLEELWHRSLEVWDISRELIKELYVLTSDFPKSEAFGLTAHSRRTGISIISNISEGATRKSAKERKRFYEIARSSLTELDAQLQIAMDLGYFEKSSVSSMEKKMRSIFKLLTVMMR